MATKKNFILVFDESVANKLVKDGFTLLSNKDSGRYMFLNNGALTFDGDEDINKTIRNIHYTNVLCMTE